MSLHTIWAMRPPAAGAISTASEPQARRISAPGASGSSAVSTEGVEPSSLCIRMNRRDPAGRVVAQRGHLDRAQMTLAAGQDRVVIEQVPVAAELADRMVRGPADD